MDSPIEGETSSGSQTWERGMLEKLLMQVYREQRRGRWLKWIWRLVWVMLILMLIGGLSGRSGQVKINMSKPHTAVIKLSGTIDSEADQAAQLRQGLQAAYDNTNVKGVIILANSPGGSPVVSNIAFGEVRRLKSEHKNIPLYVVTEDVCASGCYYIAAAADKIYADPSSMVGSIGVIGGGFDFTELMDKIGVKRRLKIAGENKGMGDPFTAETPEQAAIWQGMLNDIHQEFIKSVRLGRGERLQEAGNPDLFSGRVYTGIEAKKTGLIDDFGNVYSVARDVIKAPELVDYSPEDPFSKVIGRRLGAEAKQTIGEWVLKAW
nr:S49 family peptidase [Stenoxybacter acetivorans]